MKYILICFTFNKVKRTPEYKGEDWNHFRLELRNNWFEQCKDDDHLFEVLASFGFAKNPKDEEYRGGKCVKIDGDFTLPNTKIIVHIIRN